MLDINIGDTSSAPQAPQPVYSQVEPAAQPTQPKTAPGGGLGIAAIFAILILVVVGGETAYFFKLKTDAQAKLDTKTLEYQELDQQLNTPDNIDLVKRSVEINDQAQAFVNALQNRVYWSRLLGILQEITFKESRFINFSVDEKGTISASGEAKSLSGIAKVIVGLKKSDKLTDVTLGSLSFSEGKEGGETKVSFSVSMKLKLENLMDKKE